MQLRDLHRPGAMAQTDGDGCREGDLDRQPDPPDFWTVEELRAYLRVSRKTVYGMIQEGRIPGVKRFGRVLRVHRPTVIQWAIADRQQKRGKPI